MSERSVPAGRPTDPLWLRLVVLALAAGQLQMRYFRAGAAVRTKLDSSPVTDADTGSEALILAGLAEILPAVPVIAEESVAAGHVPGASDRFLLVDPLDGTREFVAGRTEFTVNIALVEAGRPVMGLVYAPAIGALYVVDDQSSALSAQVDLYGVAEAHALAFRRIAARPVDMGRLTAVVSRSHMTPETEAYLGGLQIAERRVAGSSLKFCTIAEGRADVYPRLGPTCTWDTAAGHAILVAAGGSVVGLEGRSLTYGLAGGNFTNPPFVAWGQRAFAV